MNKWEEKFRREHTIMEIAIDNILHEYKERKAIFEDGECTERDFTKSVCDEVGVALNWYIRRKEQIEHEYNGSEQG